jgi:hypothetical protein
MKNKKVILGIGTGRCGTVSLSDLLNKQESSFFSHELKIKIKKPTDYNTPLSWECDEQAFDNAWNSILHYNGKYVGDVSMFWLPYLERLFNIADNLKVICLQREKQGVVNSYLKKTEGRNHWMDHDGSYWDFCSWDKSYPNFKVETKEEALNRYWDYYYQLVDELIRKYPDRIRIFQMTDLNDEKKVRSLLEFAGFENKNVISNIQRNKIERNIFDKIKRKLFGA